MSSRILPRILHLDIDAFFASVEQLRNPQLAGRPVAVGTGCIASCSYEARRFGLRAGMSLSEAEQRCPSLIIVAGHQAIYRCYTDQLFDLCRRWSPVVETHLDEAFCDLTGTQQLYPDLWQVGKAIREQVLQEIGLRVTIGIGRNRMFARLAGKRAKPDGLQVLAAADEAALLSTLRVEQLPGIGPKTTLLLHDLNIETVPQLQQTPVQLLIAALGPHGRTLHERSHGDDWRPVGNAELPKSISRETTFHRPTARPLEIDAMLQYLLERASRTLRKRGLTTQGLRVKIYYSDHRQAQARHRLPVATALDSVLLDHARALLTSLMQRRVQLRLIGIALDSIRFAPQLQQAELFAPEAPTLETASSIPCSTPTRNPINKVDEGRLLQRIDKIRDLYGHSALINGRSLVLLQPKNPKKHSPKTMQDPAEPSPAEHLLEQDRNGFVLRTSSLTR